MKIDVIFARCVETVSGDEHYWNNLNRCESVYSNEKVFLII